MNQLICKYYAKLVTWLKQRKRNKSGYPEGVTFTDTGRIVVDVNYYLNSPKVQAQVEACRQLHKRYIMDREQTQQEQLEEEEEAHYHFTLRDFEALINKVGVTKVLEDLDEDVVELIRDRLDNV